MAGCGTGALVMIMVVPALFSQMFGGAPSPSMTARKISLGGLAAVPVSVFWGLGLLAMASGTFELLALILSVPLFVGLMVMSNRALVPYGLGFCVSFIVQVQPSNAMTFSVETAINTALGITIGLAIMAAGFALRAPPPLSLCKAESLPRS
nr:FUSC family protein [Achromobacter kerstersii]